MKEKTDRQKLIDVLKEIGIPFSLDVDNDIEVFDHEVNASIIYTFKKRNGKYWNKGIVLPE